ncbi:hypothetical protein M0R04_05835 [Candidatus Dojkabacteria bacterium]|jgi:hypothetical protein|nr:hypothetical protein [Candidatus Dojkabacteria bacterium]
MVYAIDDSGKMSGPIKNWATFHPVGKIHKLIITDGARIVRELSGYNKYYMESDMISVMPQQLSGVVGDTKNYIVKETIYGINDLSMLREALLNEYNNQFKKIKLSKSKDMDKWVIRLNERYNKLKDYIDKKEVVSISLLIEEKRHFLKDMSFLGNGIKKGVDSNNSIDKRFLKRLNYK